MILDRFFNIKTYCSEIVDLRENYRVDEKTAYDGVATVYYNIYKHDTKNKLGYIELRFSIEGNMYYYGHVGYNILREYRGHSYAYEACKVLFEIAKSEFNMDELIITCSPDNIASYKTLQKLGGEIIELVDVPKNHHLYLIGEKQKYIFKFKI